MQVEILLRVKIALEMVIKRGLRFVIIIINIKLVNL